MAIKIYRINDVVEVRASFRVTIYRLMNNGLFPKSIKLTRRSAVGWKSSDIDHWISTVSAEAEARYE
ncbi:helix-turn-helix transcriptional regulator [Aeromonas media]|uniref:helix-turn-helix transcriptional regulator n=1 Tax=Aeromonas media TaxID=651 RepID=UPI0038504157